MTMRRRSLLAVGLVSLAFGVLGAADVSADGVDHGDVVVVNPNNPIQPLNEGDSYTRLAFVLPDDARCGGDTEHDGYEYSTFLVPEGTDLASMQYDSVHPIGSDRYLVMRNANGSLVVGMPMASNDGPGEEATFPQIPVMSFENWVPEAFPPGRYLAGVACGPIRQPIERYWDTQFVIEADPTVEEWERRWTVVEAFQGEEPSGDSRLRVILIIVAVLASLVFIAASVPRGKKGSDSDSEPDSPSAPQPDATVG